MGRRQWCHARQWVLDGYEEATLVNTSIAADDTVRPMKANAAPMPYTILPARRSREDVSDIYWRATLTVKFRSLNSELSLHFSGLTPVQCCQAASVCLSFVLSTRGTRRAVPTVSRRSTHWSTSNQKISRISILTKIQRMCMISSRQWLPKL